MPARAPRRRQRGDRRARGPAGAAPRPRRGDRDRAEASRIGPALLRGVGVGLLGFVAYAIVPLPSGALGLRDALVTVGGVLAFAGAIGVAAVRERRASASGDAAAAEGARIEHVVALALWAIAFFALVYVRLGGVPGQFAGLVTRVDALYFTLTTLTTVGYGDIHALGQTARLVVVLQLVFNVVVLAVAVRVVVSAVGRRAGRPPA